MGKQAVAGDRFRARVKAERERRAWTLGAMAKMFGDRGVPMHFTTIAKIERGDRSVRIEEVAAFADLFGVSVDALIGRRANSTDLMWSVSKLTSAAHKAINDVDRIAQNIDSELEDVRYYAQFSKQSARDIVDSALMARQSLTSAARALKELANEFALSGH